MWHYFWPLIVGAVLLAVAFAWPPGSVFGEHLEGTTAHVKDLGDGNWAASFRVELWSQKTGKSTLWGLTVDQEGCHMVPLSGVQQGT